MLSTIALIFILFFLLVSTLLVFKKDKKEHFKLPVQTAANVPAMNHTNGKKYYVGNTENEIPDEPIVSSHGKYELRKEQLLYDGVWGENCLLDGQGYEKCDWKPTSSKYPLNKEGLTYGFDNQSFFGLPQKYMEQGERIVSKEDCPATSKMYYRGPTYIENELDNPPIYLDEPSSEDILGFPPQDNTLYWDHPGVVLGLMK